MHSPNELMAALKRLATETHTDADLRAIGQAAQEKHIALVAEKEAIAIGGDVAKANIVTGNGNVIITFQGEEAAAIIEALTSLSSLSNRGTGARDKTQARLLRLVMGDVAHGLKESLGNSVFLDLLLEEQPQRVKPRLAQRVRRGILPSSKLPPGTSIIQVFDRPDIAGRLLILGAPGAGKTTSLWVLASELIIRAANDVNKPIPVLFNLSSWADHRQGIGEWLETELKSIYGVSVDISQQWLANDQLLPLLDGLDELQSMDQEQCIEEINRFLRSSDQPSYLVVCCDLDEYERYSTKLELKGAVCLQPLTDEQIHDYLIKENCTDLWYYLEGDTEVMEFVKSPYMMSLMNLVYSEVSFKEWKQLISNKERRKYLFNKYIQCQEDRDVIHESYTEEKEPNTHRIRHWLNFLAVMLNEESQSEFLIERMQPTLIKDNMQIWIYRCLISLTVGLVFGFTIGVAAWLIHGSQWLVVSLMSIVLGGLLGSVFGYGKISPIEVLKWSGIKVSLSQSIGELHKIRWIEWIIYSVFSQLLNVNVGGRDTSQNSGERWIELLRTVKLGSIHGLGSWLISWLMGTSIGGLIRALIRGLSGPDIDIKRRKVPNQGIRKSALNAVVLAVAAGLIGWLIGILIGLRSETEVNTYIAGLFWGLIGALIGGLVPGIACIQHFFLRFFLWWNGLIPWNYPKFLSYASQRMFLQRVGGRYRFRHNLLKEHFATLELDKPVYPE